MATAPRHRRRPAGILAAGLLGVAALAGCSSEVAGTASPVASVSSPVPAPTTANPGAPEDLSAGLLPAEAFGPGTEVTPVTGEQLLAQQGQLGGGLGELADLTVTPPECAPAVEGVQPRLDDVTGLAAQTAQTGSTAVAEVLVAGPSVAGSLDDLDRSLADCPRATITAPQIGTATVTFTPLEVPDLGDGSAARTMTLSLTAPDGSPLTVPVQLGMALDGDRLVSLTVTDPAGGGSEDPAALGRLLQQAHDHQHTALD
ncbi:hypothetical protein O2W14_17575 [Modestobacter sp. VKM Ac-2986]|uniref:hypothetical protein n=1 Tax=Modestobacter sp. VKM Ac-2986 TaxID=3004140 RepID=UPI0022AB8406|nr:hypothetical protein [Modestobacter sp. VKM Ac-2986]MCZ2830651.1 hypothetical protein [Modestobacter sp. VKM Ac-2986]